MIDVDESTRGFAVLCDAEGTVLQVVHDDLGVADRVAPGRTVLTLVDASCAEKACRFLEELRRDGVAYDWELNVPVRGRIRIIHVNATADDGRLLVIGATSRSGVARFHDELMRMNNEHLNALRSALKANALRVAPGPEPAFSVYEELTRLNNDLGAAQRELARKNAELERLNAQKNQFLGMAAHDLRNPLGVILNYSDFLLDDPGAAFSTEQRAFLEIIRSSSDFMLRLVNDLLDVSLIEAGRLELDRKPVDLGRLTARAVGLNRLLAERKSILLSLSDAEDGPTLALDAGKIEQVLNNLITNAIKFSHAGTTVSVSVRRRGGAAEVAVADEGQGIPAAERERLFRPFGRTSVQPTAGEQSTGLGLSICRRIVEGHGGRIWAESQEGRGSTFTFALPLPDRADDTPPAPPLPAPAPAARRGLGVLVAEDQPVNQKMLARLLGEMGHRVTLAADGRRALEALGSEPFDVVLMDLQMPEMDGFAAVAALRARERRDGGHVPVIALTGQDGPEERPRCLAAGFDGFLAKPVRADALRALLDAMEGRGNGGEDPDATAPGPGGDADGDDDDGRSRPHPRRRRGGRGPGPDPGPDRR